MHMCVHVHNHLHVHLNERLHVGSLSEEETEDLEMDVFALKRGLPMVLNLCGDVCMWAYQPSAEPEILISFPAEPASSPGEGEIHTKQTTTMAHAEGTAQGKQRLDNIISEASFYFSL